MVPLRVDVGDPEALNNERRIGLLLEDPRTAPNEKGALVIDETGATARTARRPPRWAASASRA